MRDEGSLAIGSLAIHLTDPDAPDGDVTVYAGTGQVEFADSTIFPSYPGVGVLRSTQYGRPGTWTASGDFGTLDVTSLAVDPTSVTGDPDKVIVYAGGSGGIFRSVDGGKTWNRLTTEINVQSLALDPADAKTLWAGVTGTGIVKIDTLTGATSTLNNGLTLKDSGGNPFWLVLIAIGPSAPHTRYAKVNQTLPAVWKHLDPAGRSRRRPLWILERAPGRRPHGLEDPPDRGSRTRRGATTAATTGAPRTERSPTSTPPPSRRPTTGSSISATIMASGGAISPRARGAGPRPATASSSPSSTPWAPPPPAPTWWAAAARTTTRSGPWAA